MKPLPRTIAILAFAVAMTVTAQKDSSADGTNDVTQTGCAVTNQMENIRRLLMYGYGGGTDWHHVDISSGAVEGLDVDGVRGRCATSIFNNGLTTRNPRHE